MLDKVNCTSAYDLIQKTFVQDIRQLHCTFLYGLPAIKSVYNFYGRRRFLQVNILCENMLYVHKNLDSDLGVPLMCLLDWIEVCSISDYIT